MRCSKRSSSTDREDMAIEPERGCGFRVVGGLYFISDGPGWVCTKMPFNLESCPTCGGGIHSSRGWAWIDPKNLTGGAVVPSGIRSCKSQGWMCPGAEDAALCPFELHKAGLMWVGSGFYTPESFQSEAAQLGISKRVNSIPRDFELGQTWIFLAHPKAGRKEVCGWARKGRRCKLMPEQVCQGTDKQCTSYDGMVAEVPALFYAFRPNRLELLIDQSEYDRLHQAGNEEELATKTRKGLITLVPVPDDDPDHHTSAWEQLKRKKQLDKAVQAIEKAVHDGVEPDAQ